MALAVVRLIVRIILSGVCTGSCAGWKMFHMCWTSQRTRPNSYRFMKRPITRSCICSVLEKHPLEDSFYEGLFVKLLFALFLFICTDQLSHASTYTCTH